MGCEDKESIFVDYDTAKNSCFNEDFYANLSTDEDEVVQTDVLKNLMGNMGDDLNYSNTNVLDEVEVDENETNKLTHHFYNLTANDELHTKSVSLWTSEDLIGKFFTSVANAEAFYKAYSMIMGFGIRLDNHGFDKEKRIMISRRWVCNREGQRTEKVKNPKERKRALVPHTRCSCQAAFVVRVHKEKGIYKVTTFKPKHTHELAPVKQAHLFRSNRQITDGQAMEIRTMKDAGLRTCQIMDFMVTSLGGFNKVGFTNKDLYNFITADHERTKRLSTDAEATLLYFTALFDNDPGLYVKYAVDEKNKLCRLFWADSKSRFDYKMFGDVLVIDSTYKTNSFKMPLVEFVGVNNHYSTVVFGGCLISDETIDSYTWTFRAFMDAMNGKQPISVITDGDRAIGYAISMIIPQARHRLCTWHLVRNSRAVSADKSFTGDLVQCMQSPYSVEEFETHWMSFVKKYNLVDNAWILEMYKTKEKWAEAYFKGVFCAGMTTSQRCESSHSYLNNFVDSHLSLCTFVKQFYRAMNRIREKTLQNEFTNYQTTMPLETHLRGLEKTALNFYSRAVFYKVREELNEEMKYSTIQFETDDDFEHVVIVKHGQETRRQRKVSIRHSDKSLTCSCGRFESIGWPCRHMFCAMKALNMTSIPDVMLKRRWAKDCSSCNDGVSEGMQSTTLQPEERRFGSLHAKVYQLCHVASKTEDLYKRALSEVESIISGLLAKNSDCAGSNTVKRQRLEVNSKNIIQDPDIVRTKGSQPESKCSKGKTRCCTNCGGPGHYKPNCPLLKSEARPNDIGGSTNDDNDEDLFYSL